MRLTLRLGNKQDITWAQSTITTHHYLHQPVDPRARPMTYLLEYQGERLGLAMVGIPPHHLRVYMLIGYDPAETWERIFYRFNRMAERRIEPYPMVYNNQDKELKKFQRWAIRRYYEFVPWNEYRRDYAKYQPKVEPLQMNLFEVV